MNITTCNTFASRSGFPEYIELLRNATSSDFSLVSSCTAEICGALWGTGNPDISGVGMATGYLLESFVALGLCISSLLQQFLFRSRPNRTNLVLANASRTFFDTASLFTFSIQLACILTIAKADYGLGANGMGGTTKEITWLVSSLTLLPLALFILRPSIYQEDKHKGAAERPSLARRSSSTAPGLAEARQEYRIYTFVLCWGLAFYPFFSRMGNTFGQSMIGESKEAVISTYDWAQIENVCLRSINSMTTSQGNLITAVGVMSYLFITAIVIFKMLSSMTKGSRNKKLTWIHRLDEILDLLTSYGCIVGLGVLVFVVMLLTVQFWAFFRFRRLQCDMLEAAGSDCVDQEWSFGQIVAIAVFVPVLAESLFVWRKAMLYSGGNE